MATISDYNQALKAIYTAQKLGALTGIARLPTGPAPLRVVESVDVVDDSTRHMSGGQGFELFLECGHTKRIRRRRIPSRTRCRRCAE